MGWPDDDRMPSGEDAQIEEPSGDEASAFHSPGTDLPLTPWSLAESSSSTAKGPEERLAAATNELALVQSALAAAESELGAQRALAGFAARISSSLDRDELVGVVLECAIEALGADTGSMMIFDRFEQTMWIAKAIGLPEEVVRTTVVAMGEGIAGWVAQTGKGMVINDPDEPDKERKRAHAARSAICVPMHGPDGRLFGVINAGSTQTSGKFSDTDVARLQPLADMAAAGLRNVETLEETRRLFVESLRALVLAIETKDPYARGHTEHVTRYAVLLARKVGLDEESVSRIELAALLHDIGKPSAGEAVAIQDRPLSALEQTLIRMHPRVAAQFLEEAPSLGDVVPIIFHHHERYDGTGYLDGLKGEEIPLGARILSVADAFSAMTAERPYRKAKAMDEAIEELQAGSGTQFDPVLIDAFMKVVEETPEIFRHQG